MLNALVVFEEGIRSALQLSSLYVYATQQIRAPMSFDDILRAQIVYAVSSFDKLIHDLVRIGMVQTFTGSRTPTPRYLTESISVRSYLQLVSATIPPREFFFEQDVVNKHRHLSFQDPDKVAEALSLIWAETQKWQAISIAMGEPDYQQVRTQLKTICGRRNQIVHQADYDPFSGQKLAITQVDSEGACEFLRRVGAAIYTLVR